MLFRTTARILALPLLLPFAACSDSTGPEGGSLRGSWTLLSLDGEPLPLTDTIEDPEYGTCTITLDSMDMTFTAAEYEVTMVSTAGCEGIEEETATDVYGGTYRLSGDRIYTTAEGPMASEVSMGYSVRGDRLTLRQSFGGDLQTYVFERN